MREIHLNGYIDDAEWFGDEITPESLHEMLYPPGEGAQDDLRIILNSYGGSCNAAVRMFDDLRAYPANVHIIVSGTAASAATVLATAADRLEMTQGSLWMIHDPSVAAWGNERDLEEIDQTVRRQLNFISAQTMDTVLSAALNRPAEASPTILTELPGDVRTRVQKPGLRQ